MSVDEELLARQANKTDEAGISSEDKAAQLNLAKKESQREERGVENPKSLRQAVMAEKRKKKALKKNKKEKKGANPMSMGTAQLLKAAWQNLLVTWGLTILWIDAHVVLSVIFGKKYFCGLGEEWTMKKGRKGKGSAKTLKLVEPMGVGLINLGCLLLLIAVFFLLSFISAALNDSFKFLWDIAKDSLSGFLDLF
ncbi:MAG: hypothetical protein PF488_04145 [Patescibacteria group bacterium]|jgi:hypothetical protein|nr:hypothetical protein [Patescibacteria group bacterium]